MASTLKDWHEKKVMVVTSDGRIIVGILVGHDQVQNLILRDAQERIYSADQPVEKVPLGLYLIRGDNVCVVGEPKTSSTSGSSGAEGDDDDDQIRVPEPLPSIHQQQLY